MRGHAYLTSIVTSVAIATLAWSPAAAVDAAYCVTCTGPDQTYLCHVTGEEVGRTDAFKLYCIVRIAKEGGHASCGARNEVAGCHGTTKVYAYDGPSLPGAAVGQSESVETGVDEAFEQQQDEAPKTLVEATGRAYSASRRGIRNMRASLGGAREEESHSSLPASSTDVLPSSSAETGTLPELPGRTPSPLTPLPSSMTPDAQTHAALLPPEARGASVPPAESKGRIRRGAQNVGTFARKSYRCVRSLFRKCSQPEALAPN